MTENNRFPENIIGVMDDFISHLNKTKKLFMILILSSFIVAPLSLIFAFILITPQVLTQAGEPYVVSLSAPGILYETPQLTVSPTQNYSHSIELGQENVSAIPITFEIVPLEGHPVQHVRVIKGSPGENFDVYHKVIVTHSENQNHSESVWVTQDDITVKYFPLKSFEIQNEIEPDGVSFKFQQVSSPQPRFMFINDSAHLGKQFDVTTLIFVLVAVSSILASFWIYVGIREYKFFANWNKKYDNYKKLQERIDKELGD